MRDVTRIFIIVVFAGIVIYDVYAFATVGEEGTISSVIWEWNRDQPWIPFLAGVVVDHLFLYKFKQGPKDA